MVVEPQNVTMFLNDEVDDEFYNTGEESESEKALVLALGNGTHSNSNS